MGDSRQQETIATGLPGRIDLLRTKLGLNKTGMAKEMQRILGATTAPARISEWASGKKTSVFTLAGMALLHPDPRRCFEWLRDGGDYPVGSDHHPSTQHAEARVLAALAVLDRGMREANRLLQPPLDPMTLQRAGEDLLEEARRQRQPGETASQTGTQ